MGCYLGSLAILKNKEQPSLFLNIAEEYNFFSGISVNTKGNLLFLYPCIYDKGHVKMPILILDIQKNIFSYFYTGNANPCYTVVEVKENHIYFRVHPNVQAAYTKEISAPSEADESGYRLRFSLEDGDKVNVGGYVISREGNKICTDRSALFEKFPNHRVKFETPELKDGFEIEAYVNPNQISVFVNNGEAVITNTVYDLKKEINTNVKVKIETL